MPVLADGMASAGFHSSVVFVGGLVALLMVPLALVMFSLISRAVFAWELIVVAVALGVLWLLKPLYDLIDSNVVVRRIGCSVSAIPIFCWSYASLGGTMPVCRYARSGL